MRTAPKSIVAVDCGSTTTKAVLLLQNQGRWRLSARSSAATTVEQPFEDVTLGVRGALQGLEELSGRRLLNDDGIILPSSRGEGVDAFLATSSAGGGLQMAVAGVVSNLSAESAERAALGAGAVVMDVLAIDDGHAPHEKVDRISRLRPDIILLSGGVDGGNVSQVVAMSELLFAAGPRPRFGRSALPVVYAGNPAARRFVENILGRCAKLYMVDNIRPRLEEEDVSSASRAIQEIFMNHVMAEAPNYAGLLRWVSDDILPTPRAVGDLLCRVSSEWSTDLLAVDVGGATTDVFSVHKGRLYRSVSANLGMSYSICNVLAQAGTAAVQRWLPFEVDDTALHNFLGNKMLRPICLPESPWELMVEQAVAREILRLSLEQHRRLARGLMGVQQRREIHQVFDQPQSGATLVDMMAIPVIIGSGGVLSHAPRRAQAALIMIDGLQPEGISELWVDSIFMLPQLGVVHRVFPQAAWEVLMRDCLWRLGTVVAPKQPGDFRPGQLVMRVWCEDGRGGQELAVRSGELQVVPVDADSELCIRVVPAPGWDVGAGRGVPVTRRIRGGLVGMILDARGRPIRMCKDGLRARQQAREWLRACAAYPDSVLDGGLTGHD